MIGETADDARSRVDKFLDNAFLAQLQRVRHQPQAHGTVPRIASRERCSVGVSTRTRLASAVVRQSKVRVPARYALTTR